MAFLRCGSVRFSEIVTTTVRFGAVSQITSTLRCGSVLLIVLRRGSVRFSDVLNLTVRFGAILYSTVRFDAVFRYRKTYGAMRWYGAVRCG